jgi:SAM-dependent methyltransferase
MGEATMTPRRSLAHLAGVPGRRAKRQVRRISNQLRDGTPAERQWVRTVMLRDIRAFLTTLPIRELDAVECSSATYVDEGWQRHTSLTYPDFDLTDPPADIPTFDVVFCEQVLEHVTDPWAAAETLRALCRPGGHVIVSTPFLLRIHNAPGDYWRFTPDGLRILLERGGLQVTRVEAWGNRAAVRTNTFWWAAQRPWRSLRNVDDVPAVVWAFCRRPDDP